MKKWIALTIYVVAAILLYSYRDETAAWLRAGQFSWSRETAVLLVGFVIAVVPPIPYSLVAVLFGAKYGPFAGSVINLSVAVSAAAVLFLFVRYVYTEDQRRKAAEMKGVANVTGFFERNAFMALLFARMLPVVPAQAVTIYAALTRMRWRPYLLATLLGKAPFLLAVTLLGDQIMHPAHWKELLLPAGIYGCFLLAAGCGYRIYKRRVGTGIKKSQ